MSHGQQDKRGRGQLSDLENKAGVDKKTLIQVDLLGQSPTWGEQVDRAVIAR